MRPASLAEQSRSHQRERKDHELALWDQRRGSRGRGRAPAPQPGRLRHPPAPPFADSALTALLSVGGAGQNMTVPRSTVPLVGRVAELTSLVDALGGAREGRSAAVVLGGDAGVGKTRLLSELLASPAAERVLCLVGHCVDLGDTPPPYLPFTEAFTRLGGERPECADQLVAEFPVLARLMPGRSDARTPIERGELF